MSAGGSKKRRSFIALLVALWQQVQTYVTQGARHCARRTTRLRGNHPLREICHRCAKEWQGRESLQHRFYRTLVQIGARRRQLQGCDDLEYFIVR